MNSATLPNPVISTERKCTIEEVFDQGFIDLIKLVPRNAFVRGLILKFTGKTPYTGCDTYEQLKDWVELNCAKRIRPTQVRSSDTPGISVRVDFSETEYGRADYSVRRYGSERYNVGGEELLQLIQDAIDEGQDIEHVVDTLADRLDEDAWSLCDPELNDYDDYEYSQHESTDSGSGSVEFSRQEVRDAMNRFIRENHPELAAQL